MLSQTTSLVLYLFSPKATDMSYSSHVFGEEKLWLVSNAGDAWFELPVSKADMYHVREKMVHLN
jgi:hypothetical protein